MRHSFVVVLLISILSVSQVSGHGRLIEPPSRNSAWRFRFPTPHDYNDHGESVWCGGRGGSNNGQSCGVCGDPPRGRKNNEVGGRLFTGRIIRNYQPGQWITVKTQVTAAHRNSWLEIKLCPATSNRHEVSQQCLDRNVLEIQGHGRRYNMPFRPGVLDLRVKLPNNIRCDRCVLQWTWHSRGTLEMYRACSDVKIGKGGTSGGGGGGGKGRGGGGGGGCQSHDRACRGGRGSQANCCGGLYCHKPVASWAEGRCYNRG